MPNPRMQAHLRDVAKNIPHSGPAGLRPVITSLNGDNSWLISIPRPADDIRRVGRAYFHIVYDPWLAGTASQIMSWLISIDLTLGPAATCATDVEAMVDAIEQMTMKSLDLPHKQKQSADEKDTYNGGVDAILVGFHFSDHAHKATLETFDPRIPVLATKQAAQLVRPWNHFSRIEVIYDMKDGDKSWLGSEQRVDALPEWLSVVHMPGHHELNFLLALVWTHADKDGETIHEAIVSSPHGVRLDQKPVQEFLKSEPATRKLAMLHCTKDGYAAGIQNTYGLSSGVALHEALGGCEYWVTSHSSRKKYTGILLRLAGQKDIGGSLDEEMERQGVQGERPDLVDVVNGDALVLA